MNGSKFYMDWLKKAEEDELMGNLAITENGPASAGCFHFQQMAEKLLKALLIYSGKEFPKIHDLVGLGKLIEPLHADIKSLTDELKTLSQFYVETRYPGDYPEFTLTETKQAQAAAMKVKKFVSQKIGYNK